MKRGRTLSLTTVFAVLLLAGTVGALPGTVSPPHGAAAGPGSPGGLQRSGKAASQTTPSADARFEPAIARAREVLEKIVKGGRAPGIGAAVAVDGEVVWNEGFGFADLERSTPVTPTTRFGIGSLSKTLTMAAALALVDAGRLRLDAPVESYLPDFPHKGKGVTLRRLAAHQSGISDDFAVRHYLTTRHFDTLNEAYREIARGRLQFEPGSRTEYATGLYTIIGRVMEEAAKQPYLIIMNERVFAPAGLTTIAPNDPAKPIAARTGFYVEREGGGFEKAPPFDPSFKLPGAGFLATAGDMARFGAALLRPGAIITAASRAEMFEPVPLSDGTATEFALGLRAGAFDGHPMLHLPGGGPGISAWLFIHPADGLVIALLSNATTGPVGGRTHADIARAFQRTIRATRRGPASSAREKRPRELSPSPGSEFRLR